MPKSKKYKRSLFARFSKRPLLVIVLSLVLLIGGGLAYNQLNDNRSANESAPDSSDTQSGDYVNLDPATEQDKQETEENKKSLAEAPGPPPTSNGKKQVTPLISSADRSEVRAYVPGIFEDGGTCTATATKGAQTETAISKGFKNVSDTQCMPIEWSLLSGGWSVVVSYSSSTAQGKSEPSEVE